MDGFSVDYPKLVASIADPVLPASVGEALLSAAGDLYESMWPEGMLLEFEQSGAVYLFDQASATGGERADRTIAAWAVTPETVNKRDTAYQRGFPMASDDSSPVDRGHIIPHLSGGEFGPNIFRQDRALNRGWSEEGKRFRALERMAASTPGAFYFGHLLYADNSDYPSWIEVVVLKGASARIGKFNNKPGRCR